MVAGNSRGRKFRPAGRRSERAARRRSFFYEALHRRVLIFCRRASCSRSVIRVSRACTEFVTKIGSGLSLAKQALGGLMHIPLQIPLFNWNRFRNAIEHGLSTHVLPLLRERSSSLQAFEASNQRMWMSAAFLVDFENSKEAFSTFFQGDRNHIWALRELIRKRGHEHGTLVPLSIQQREFIVLTFGGLWPPAPRPSSSAGDTNPWNAHEFISGMINAIGRILREKRLTASIDSSPIELNLFLISSNTRERNSSA